jgi:hypothetical protein
VQGSTRGSVTWRRHLPTCITSGMLSPVGTFSSVKRPAVSVMPATTGLPETLASQVLQLAPSTKASSGALGTYTVTL